MKHRPIALALAVAGLVTVAATSASAQEQWFVSEYSEPGTGRVGTITYGVPQTDDITVSGRCFAAARGQVELTLYVDAFGFNPGAQAPVTFRAPGSAELNRTGVIVDSEMFGPHPILTVQRSDALIGLLAAARSVDVAVFNNTARTIQLRGSSAAISQFNGICNSIDGQGAPPAAAAAPSPGTPLLGPLFLAPQQAMPVYANFNGGGNLEPFPPGTELMSLNTTGSLNGQELVQVATLRGAGVTGWVPRAMLIPTSGGASEYQNLNQAANLVLRSAPSPTASSVGTVPPFARGIFDLGQRGGNYVYVRYGNLSGWASHDYLAPILLPLSGGAGQAGKGPGAPGLVPVTDPGKPVLPVAGGGAGAPLDPGKVPIGSGGPPAPPTPPEKVPVGGGVGGAGPNSSAFAGSWRFTAEKGCPGCVLTIANAGGLLRVTSNEGWQVELISGVDGDPSYATGEGTWTGGLFAGQRVTVDAFLEGAQLRILRSVPQGYVEQTYSRF